MHKNNKKFLKDNIAVNTTESCDQAFTGQCS